MNARIYSPSKNAMQSGLGKTGEWVLEYESRANRSPEPLMGWTTGDTLGQVRLKFKTLEEARAYAIKQGLSITVLPPHERKIRPRNYADNFVYRAEDEA
jgi:hypothetical protein